MKKVDVNFLVDLLIDNKSYFSMINLDIKRIIVSQMYFNCNINNITYAYIEYMDKKCKDQRQIMWSSKKNKIKDYSVNINNNKNYNNYNYRNDDDINNKYYNNLILNNYDLWKALWYKYISSIQLPNVINMNVRKFRIIFETVFTIYYMGVDFVKILFEEGEEALKTYQHRYGYDFRDYNINKKLSSLKIKDGDNIFYDAQENIGTYDIIYNNTLNIHKLYKLLLNINSNSGSRDEMTPMDFKNVIKSLLNGTVYVDQYVEINRTILNTAINNYERNYGLVLKNIEKNNFSTDIIQYIINAGANIDRKVNYARNTILYYAIDENKIPIVSLLLNNGVKLKINITDDNDINNNSDEDSDDGYNNVYEYNTEYDNNLLLATRNAKMAKILVDGGVDYKILNKEGQNLLYFFSGVRCSAVTKYLISLGLDINSKDNNGNTPLHIAIEDNNVSGSKFLLNNKADYTIKNNKNQTPFDLLGKKLKIRNNIIKLGIEIPVTAKTKKITKKSKTTKNLSRKPIKILNSNEYPDNENKSSNDNDDNNNNNDDNDDKNNNNDDNNQKCSGITLKGTKCGKKIKSGSKYCYLHSK